MNRRVVISGVGTVTGLGVGAPALWEGLVGGRSSLGQVSLFDTSGFDSRLGGEAKGFSAKDFVPKSYRKAVKVMARDIELAVAAAKLAVDDAGLVTRMMAEGGEAKPTYASERIGCQIGAGLIAFETEEMALAVVTARDPDPKFTAAGGFSSKAWGTREGGRGGMNNLQPLWMLKYLPNMLACHVTIIHGCEGPSNTITCAEASGLLSLGESLRVIQRDAADICFSGGAESKLSHMGVLRMSLTKRLASTGDATEGSAFVRPYDPEAPGQVLGEAGGILILEEAAKAAARGRRPYAEIAGFGAAQSGLAWQHRGYTAGSLDTDEGLRFAITQAIDDAKIKPEDVDVIIPHGAGVAGFDAPEAGALRAVFGERLSGVPLVTVTPNIGECVAGHGAALAATGALVVRHQMIPARIHAGNPAPGLQAGSSPSRPANIRHALVCTSSQGGQNAALVLKAVE